MMNDDALWVFAYGSLVWNPGFKVAEKHIGHVAGFARSFCMSSIHHRGTVEQPGLVLALDAKQGASCEGVALLSADPSDVVLDMLRERELVSSAYYEDWIEVTLRDGRTVKAVTYIIDPIHVQYCADLSLETQAQIIARSTGGRGPNCEYLYNTSSHLESLGLRDDDLKWLSARVREIKG